MALWVCHVEGVNFSATLLDTKDLSTVRGSSLALLHLDKLAEKAVASLSVGKPDKIFSGASQCAFSFENASDESKLSLALTSALIKEAKEFGEIPFKHLSVICGIAPLPSQDKDPKEKALNIARARALASQHRRWTLPAVPFSGAAKRADKFDGLRPATQNALLPDGDGKDKKHNLSESVAARRTYGREQRQKFYGEELAGQEYAGVAKGFKVTDSIQDIVSFPPAGVKDSPRSKVAVIYADGNGFGDVRRSVGTDVFAKKLGKLRKMLLADIVRWLRAGAESDAAQAFKSDDHEIRFETVLWGGDELMFVMPSWLAFSFVEGFFHATRDWKIDEKQLTHAVGVVIANAKTPIRQMKDIAKQAADAAKEAGLNCKNTVTFEIFESLSPPDDSLSAMRKGLFGAKEADEIPKALAIPGASFTQTLDDLEKLTADDGEGFPRSQIYRVLNSVRREHGTVFSLEASNAVAIALDKYAGRMNSKMDSTYCRLPTFDRARKAGLDLTLIAQFWDYIHPVGGTAIPRMSAKGGV